MADRYVCGFCGTSVEPDRTVTQLDPRYAMGKCPKCEIKGLRQLVREDVDVTLRAKRKR